LSSRMMSPLGLRSTTRLVKPRGPLCIPQVTRIALRLSRDAFAVAPSTRSWLTSSFRKGGGVAPQLAHHQ
jgi:hypothetical protein